MIRCYLLVTMLLLKLATSCFAYEPGYDTTIRPGAVRTHEYITLLKGKRVAVIVNQTSSIENELLPDVLIKNKVNVTKIFVPEHGFRGVADAGAKVENSIDSATNLPIISLYGKHKKPTAEDLADIDVVVYDLQDVGVRFYTYISTLEYCMEACAENHKQFIVLDRPNPNGFYVDGPVLEAENKSFVGMQRIPIVYGMTAGEYAKMLRGEKWFNKASQLNLQVIKCLNYTHSKRYRLPVAPSPNLKTMAAIYAYPSLCLFEGTPVSVGRGTDRPFQQYGCPEFKGMFTHSFTPRSMVGAKTPPFENKECFGELIGESESEVLQKTGGKFRLEWVIKAYNAYPDKEKFFNGFFVSLYGSTKGREQIKSGMTEAAIKETWKDDLEKFKKVREKYLLYNE